ncbi:hypothetical protein BJP24_01085 [Aeromonas allosaccharophila]|uniref:hypothetical protein n=1 Tax=Aeromonas allosaccharophila TaxID=656 RepID=UPI0005B209A1|nr:hypothetical protein [Aeromonas allosaccharophila]OKP46452.1 hypothetical protein BJP24_01085 [Aeromonas allosaccharophila]
MRLIDKAKLVLVTLVIALTLLCSITRMESPLLPAYPHSEQQQTQVFNQVSDSDDGVIKFVGSHQNHLLRLEQSLRSDDQPDSVVYELIQSWSAQAILLLLLGWLMLAPELYHKQSFRHHFGAIHRRHLQHQHLQYRFNQSYLSA